MPEPARPRLEVIRAVTYLVPDLRVVEEVYTRWLGYRVVARAELSEAAARAWGAPALSRRPAFAMQPASGEPVQLRFVAAPEAGGWQALTTHGWNVSEIVVQDVDALAAKLRDSPFRIIGPPAGLQRFPMIRAMQVVGPFGECLYFTEVGPGSGLSLASARSFVGRVFIVVAGGPDLDALFGTYAAFANDVDPPVSTRVRVISLANGLPPDTEHAHGLVRLSNGTLIELDQYPAVTRPRARIGALHVGMAIVTFAVDALSPAMRANAYEACQFEDECPAALVTGATGEIIELVERADA